MERKGEKHNDTGFVVHPDVRDWNKRYKPGSTFGEVSEERDKKLGRGEPFWETDHDIEMKQTASQRSWEKIVNGEPWPTKQKRKKR